MNAIDQYDIREAFEALDGECQGSLGFANLHTLYLGLGFATPRRMTVEYLKKDARAMGYSEDVLSLEETFKLFAKYSRERSSELSECFRALVDDTEERETLTYQDLLRASKEVGEPLSESNAKHMVAIASGGKERIREKGFVQLFAPPEP